VAISVADTGIGIPTEFRDKLFVIAGITSSRDHECLGGSGLGLYMCK
jgi:signal transduction histidine kinase